MTENVKRFDPTLAASGLCAYDTVDMYEDSDGEYVLYEDYKKLLDALHPPAPKGWKWMRHPAFCKGVPIPVRFFNGEEGDELFQPFGDDLSSYIEDMDSLWEEMPGCEAIPEGYIAVRKQDYDNLEAYKAATPKSWQRFMRLQLLKAMIRRNEVIAAGFNDIFKKDGG